MVEREQRQRNQNNTIYDKLEALLDFAGRYLMLEPRDRLVARHRLYLFLGLEGRDCSQSPKCQESPQHTNASQNGDYEPQGEQITNAANPDIYALCAGIQRWAAEHRLYDGQSPAEGDLFLANLVGQLMPLPSQLEQHFWQLYRSGKAENGPRRATAFFYQLSQNAAYIRNDRLARNFSWHSDSSYGRMEITINLSKPEKDPKAIAAAGEKQNSGYPQCALCLENEGYPGHLSWAPRFNHRVVGLELDGKSFALQYSPYLYYPEHSILLSREHKPMCIDRASFAELLDFVRQFPHYMAGSNADLPIVGGSILAHHHFQAGCYEFPMFRAGPEIWSGSLNWRTVSKVRAEVIRWPLSCLKLSGPEPEALLDPAEQVLRHWRRYSDHNIGVLAHSDGKRTPHNTITPIVRRTPQSGAYEIFLVLRNNRCSEEHPLGIYHPHAEIHHIKKENIGLIEVMGLAILPGRLKEEMPLMQQYLAGSREQRAELRQQAALRPHLPWLESLRPPGALSPSSWRGYLQGQIAEVFAKGLSHCGVLRSREAWQRFLSNCKLLRS